MGLGVQVVEEHSLEAIQDARALFLARDLASARTCCEGLIQSVQLAAPPQRDMVQAHARYWAVRCARRQNLPDEALKLAYDGIAAAQAAGLQGLECFLLAEVVRVLGELGLHHEALLQADPAIAEAYAGIY